MLSPKVQRMQRSIRINEGQLLGLAEKARYDSRLAGVLHKRCADSNKWLLRWFRLYQVNSFNLISVLKKIWLTLAKMLFVYSAHSADCWAAVVGLGRGALESSADNLILRKVNKRGANVFNYQQKAELRSLVLTICDLLFFRISCFITTANSLWNPLGLFS